MGLFLTRILDGRNITPSMMEQIGKAKDEGRLFGTIAEVRRFLPNSDSVGYCEALPVMISRGCSLRGGMCPGFTEPKGEFARNLYDPERDGELERYLEGGGRDVWISTGLDPFVPFFVFERAVHHAAKRKGVAVGGFSPRFLAYAVQYYLDPEQALARLVVAGLAALGDEPPPPAGNGGGDDEFGGPPMRPAKPLNPWIEICHGTDFAGVVRRADKIRVYARRHKDRFRPPVESVTVCCFDHRTGENRCTLDRLEVLRRLAAVRLLLKDVPYLSVNTGGFERDILEAALDLGYTDLGITPPAGFEVRSPFLKGNLTADEAEGLIRGKGYPPRKRGVDFLKRA